MEQLTFSIKGKTYTTEPVTIGRIVDLWKMRTTLSMGTYGQLFRYVLVGADAALKAVDIEAFFAVFCPDLLNDLKPTSISEMGLQDYIEIRDVYDSEISPWLSKVEAMLKKKSDD